MSSFLFKKMRKDKTIKNFFGKNVCVLHAGTPIFQRFREWKKSFSIIDNF